MHRPRGEYNNFMPEIIRQFGQRTFSSLTLRNYRLYFIGQGISQIGTWMQIVGMGWLVLQLTGSGVALGTLLGLRFTPLLFAGPLGGAIVDRFNKRRLVLIIQSAFAITAFALAILVFSNAVQMWMLYLLVFINGLIDIADRPARQTFIHEMVGPEYLRNAVTLNSTMVNAARAIGPFFAGILIAGAGLPFCFLVNAFSYIAVLIMLLVIRTSELHHEPGSDRPLNLDVVVEGFRYARSIPIIRDILISVSIIGTLTYEFQVSLPLFANQTFAGTAADYAALLSAMGAGSIAGGLFAASREKVASHEFIFSAFLFGLSMVITAFMPTLAYATVGMIFVGFFSINLTSVGNTMIQLESDSTMRGRVMSLWAMAIFGSTVIGGPIIGFISQYASPRWGLAVGGIAALFTAVLMAPRMLTSDQLRLVPSFIRTRSEETDFEDSKMR